MTDIQIEKYEGEVVYLNNGGEWAYIIINEKTGMFMAHTTFGAYSHWWNAPGPEGLKKFLGRLEYDYAMGKLADGRGYAFDGELAFERLKKHLFKMRRDGDIKKRDARKAYDDLEDLDHDTDNSHVFAERLARCGCFLEVVGHDDWWHLVDGEVPDGQCVGFWNKIFIPFVASYMPEHNLKPKERRP